MVLVEAGEFVARKLNFPDLLVDVVRHHHDPSIETGNAETDRIIRAVAAGNVASRAMGYAFTNPITPDECAADPIWQMLAAIDEPGHVDHEELVEEVFNLQDELDEYVGALMKR